MKFITNDDVILEGNTYLQVVEDLNNKGIAPVKDIREFMSEVAKRVRIQGGGHIRTHSPKGFVEDLTALGFLREERGK